MNNKNTACYSKNDEKQWNCEKCDSIGELIYKPCDGEYFKCPKCGEVQVKRTIKSQFKL